MMQKKILSQIVSIQKKRFKKAFGKVMNEKQLKDLEKTIRKAFDEKQLLFRADDTGKMIYVFQYQLTIMHEFNEQFFYVPFFWSREDAGSGKKLLAAMMKEARKVKKEKKIARMIVSVSAEEPKWMDHFKKTGKLTYVELVGNTRESLSRLKKEKLPSGYSFSRLKSMDVPAMVKLELESHINDPSSRMQEIFSRPIGRKLMKNFYRNLVKSKKCFVVRKNGRYAGGIAWFIDKKNHYGLVGSIFVAENFKGQGLSKLMYKKLLEEFKRKKCSYYIGASTTERVLSLAKTMKRRPSSYSYII